MPAADPPSAAVATLPPEAARAFDRAPSDPAGKPYVSAVPRRCPPAPDGAIVVCGSDPDRFRIKPLATEFRNDPVQAEIGLGDGIKLDAHLDSATLVGGAVSKRVMVGVKLKF